MDEGTKNGVKNGETTQFSSETQPSNEAKKAGWLRRKQGLAFMDKVAEYLNLSVSDLENIESDIQKNKDKYTVRDMMAINYVFKAMKSDKYLIHFLDLHISKAPPANPKDDEEKKPLTKIILEVVNTYQGEPTDEAFTDPKQI